MLVDLLDQSIIAMKEIYELEKSSNDVQKQEKNDKIFSNVVSENHLMVNAVTNSMSQLGFVISQETRGEGYWIALIIERCSIERIDTRIYG